VIGVFVFLLDRGFGWLINFIHPVVTTTTQQ